MKLPDPAYASLPGNVPPPVNSGAFEPVDTGGAIDTLFANSGIVSLRNRTEQSPVGVPGQLLRKLTHFRAPGMGDAMWSGACVYDVAGVAPSYSEYDEDSTYVADDGLDGAVSGGIVRTADRMPLQEPTLTRQPRLSAHYDSAPSAAFFQGYFNPRWSGLLSGYRPQIQPRPLHSNFNPAAMGTKELHKATQYRPVPPMGSLVGYFGSNDKAV